MFEDQILNDFLDNAANRAKANIKEKGRLETDDAIPLMLKSQFNHIAHLELGMVTKIEFNERVGNLEVQFQAFKEKLNWIQWMIGIGFTFLGFLMTYLSFFK